MLNDGIMSDDDLGEIFSGVDYEGSLKKAIVDLNNKIATASGEERKELERQLLKASTDYDNYKKFMNIGMPSEDDEKNYFEGLRM